jgi:hypothetical protein
MEFRCEDLPDFGVILMPSTSPESAGLRADIEQRLHNQVAGAPPLPRRTKPPLSEDGGPFAILINRGPRAIASIEQVWSYRVAGGRVFQSSFGGGFAESVLLPFGLLEKILKLYRYWHVILPGSKRLLSSGGEILGDNTDVRPPGPDEMWTGGVISVQGGGGQAFRDLESVTLTLDGVFFTDGGFAGSNQYGLWDQVVARAQVQLQVARIARSGHNAGSAVEQIFADIEKRIGPAGNRPPAPPAPNRSWSPEEYRRYAAESLAYTIGVNRRSFGDERMIYHMMDWDTAPVPRFHKL